MEESLCKLFSLRKWHYASEFNSSVVFHEAFQTFSISEHLFASNALMFNFLSYCPPFDFESLSKMPMVLNTFYNNYNIEVNNISCEFCSKMCANRNNLTDHLKCAHEKPPNKRLRIFEHIS